MTFCGLADLSHTVLVLLMNPVRDAHSIAAFSVWQTLRSET